MHLSLLSVTTTVTGSKTLVSYKSRQILVDCDLFQGYTCLREMNRDEFPLDRTRSGLSVDVSAQSPRCAALRLRRLGINTQQEMMVYMRRNCYVCRA